MIWKRLVSDHNKKIPVWWEMKNSYKEDMEKFINMIEDEDDLRDIKVNIYILIKINLNILFF